ncbi:MAG: Glucose-1-phosphate thymidylyltransferase [Ignavibacteriae bacterium]|nr:MAG: Glucose-1-phosphate thymidylyltransferase [Ignavibacteriota bacterium]
MGKINYYIYEDKNFSNFYPLTYLRPIYDLRCGVFSLREKIEKCFNIKKINLLSRPILTDLLRETYPEFNINQFSEGNSVFINGRLIANRDLIKQVSFNFKNDVVYKTNNQVVIVCITDKTLKYFLTKWKRQGFPLLEDEDFVNFKEAQINANLASYPWDLIVNIGSEIEKDFELLKKKSQIKKIKHSDIVNPKNVVIGKHTKISSNVVIDATDGPVIIGKNVLIMPQSTIVGPAFIGDQTIIKIGAKIYSGCSIGEVCKVGGELDSVIIQSHSNKQHDGYLGHAYVGSWANFGAGTNNSDLKNNYSKVKAVINGELINTNLQHFGMLFGDHSKTGINMMFDTGTVVGICCNLYGAGLPPRYIPSFVRGTPEGPLKTNSLEMVIDTARIVMQRRNKILSDSLIKLLGEVFENTKEQRNKFNIL